MNKETFRHGIGILMKTFPDKDMDFDTYWELLQDLPEEKFLEAIKVICLTLKEFYPGTNMIAIIRDHATTNYNQNMAIAWKDVLKEVSRVGHNGRPEFQDDLTAQAVECIGWHTICCSKMVGVERAHFFKIYPQLKYRDIKKTVKDIESRNDKGIKRIENLVKKIGLKSE